MILRLALTLLMAAPAAVAADPVDWLYAHCATGEITEYHVTKPDRLPVVTVEGWAQPCGEAAPASSFAILYVTPTANVVPELSPYDTLDAPTEFSVSIPHSPLAAGWWVAYGGVRAICLVHGPASWLGCVRLEPGTDGLPQVTPWTPTGAELCARVAVIPTGEVYEFVEPNCGTCV